MKLLIGLVSLFASATVMAAAPQYTTSSRAILGAYEELTADNCAEEETGEPCVNGHVSKRDGKTYVYINDINVEAELRNSGNGRVTFSWDTAEEQEDCDDPGCSNVTGVSGVIFPKKVGNRYVATLKVFVKRYYPYGFEDDESNEPQEITETFEYRRRD